VVDYRFIASLVPAQLIPVECFIHFQLSDREGKLKYMNLNKNSSIRTIFLELYEREGAAFFKINQSLPALTVPSHFLFNASSYHSTKQ